MISGDNGDQAAILWTGQRFAGGQHACPTRSFQNLSQPVVQMKYEIRGGHTCTVMRQSYTINCLKMLQLIGLEMW